MDILKGNILVVNDHPDNLDLLTRLLEKRGFKFRLSHPGLLRLKLSELARQT
jgi:CheY-like chemotaxis protein